YCFYGLRDEDRKVERIKLMAKILRDSALPNYNLPVVSFSGIGEPLLYIRTIKEHMKAFRDIERKTGQKPWYFLYTNGILADKDMLLQLRDLGFDEIRFHSGASNFSKEVYRNLSKAVVYFKAVTVETPSWPPHRKKLFQMLPIIEGIGVKHLNLGEIEIRRDNFNRITKILPDAEIYQCYEMHLDDGGLVYDIIEEVLKQKYSYSVLDCSSFVKNIQRSPAKSVLSEEMKEAIANY
ncbi:MAG: hypothetical protein ABIA66_03865, partial [Candidatus Omnitrophota bacterium]